MAILVANTKLENSDFAWYEFYVDNVADIDYLPTRTSTGKTYVVKKYARPMSTAYCISEARQYMLDSSNKWRPMCGLSDDVLDALAIKADYVLNLRQDTEDFRNAAKQSAQNSANSAVDSASSASESASSASASASSASAAKVSEENAAASSAAAQASESNALKSENNAADCAASAAQSAEKAKIYVGTDSTLSTEGAPADAKATGDALAGKADKTEVSNALSQKSDTTHTHDLSALINTLSTGSSTPQDADYYVSQYVGGGDTTTTYHRRPMSALWAYIKGKADVVFAAKSHTHNYAGSGSAGGSANSAVKLDTATAGSATKPVYISGGKPVACTHSLGKDVPADAVFTDHTYSAATQSAAGLMSAADKKRLDNLYPVGSIYQSTDPTSPAALFGGTWEQIASERVLMGASSSHAAGSTVEAGLPNIKFSFTAATVGSKHQSGGDYSVYGASSSKFNLDASKSNAIYGASTTVQPAAYYVHIWRRVA